MEIVNAEAHCCSVVVFEYNTPSPPQLSQVVRIANSTLFSPLCHGYILPVLAEGRAGGREDPKKTTAKNGGYFFKSENAFVNPFTFMCWKSSSFRINIYFYGTEIKPSMYCFAISVQWWHFHQSHRENHKMLFESTFFYLYFIISLLAIKSKLWLCNKIVHFSTRVVNHIFLHEASIRGGGKTLTSSSKVKWLAESIPGLLKSLQIWALL